MPIRSQHFPVSFEDWERVPRPPGWKYEYFDGCAHIRPSHQIVVTTAEVAPRPVNAPCAFRPVRSDDEARLLAVYVEAFADDPVYCDYGDEQFRQAAAKDLCESFTGGRAPLLDVSRVAVTAGRRASLLGAALLSHDREYGPVLDLLLIRPAWQRRGVATALVASAMNALHETGERRLTSCYHLANLGSQAWHRAFGFVERPDLRYAEACFRHARHELSRREADGKPIAAAGVALAAEVRRWQEQITALQRLEAEQGFRAAHPRVPHS